MTNDFYDNLTTITNNLEDIAFTKYATITNLNSDGTCTAKEDEEEGLTHENVPTLSHNLRVGDKVVLGFVDNSIYNPVILTGGEEAYTKTETDALLQKKINEPLNEGTNGQVLTTDGAGGRTWKTVQGGGGTGGIIMVGSFTINNEGHLIATIPNGADNPYYINANGHLIYDTVNSHNEGEIT